MPRAPRVTAKDLIRALKRDGWVEARHTGSHLHLTHPEKPGRVTIPMHSGQTLHPAILASVLQQADLSIDQLRGLL